MGLLDDAIRDHLELKRRHGADPGEVSKLEHEAFGPIQREDALEVGPPPPLDDTAEHELAEEEEAAYEESELEADEEWEVEHPGETELVYEDEPPATGGQPTRAGWYHALRCAASLAAPEPATAC